MRTCMRETREREKGRTKQSVRVGPVWVGGCECVYGLYHVPHACTHVEAEE